MNRIRLQMLLLLLMMPFTSMATTNIMGQITNMTWSAANSPYVIKGDITILSGATLTIEPGVEIQINSSDDQGSGMNPNKVEIIVNGSLLIQGTANNPITIHAQSGAAKGTWSGIEINNFATPVTIDHANIQDAESAIQSAAPNISITNSSLSNNSANGLNVTAGNAILINDIMTENAVGLLVQTTGSATVANSLVYTNTSGVENSQTQDSLSLVNCTIYGNMNSGVYVHAGANSKTSIKNTAITSNSIGVNRTSGTALITYSDIWGNVVTNLSNVVPSSGSFSQNPGFVSAPTNFHLTPLSVLIDAGTSTGAPLYDLENTPRPLDGNGTNGAGVDIGAYEYRMPIAEIQTQPNVQSVMEGGTAAFVVLATGDYITYQWQKSGADIVGANSPSYTTPVLSYADSGAKYTCVISNPGGTVVSDTAALSVLLHAPTIVSQPLSQQVSEGSIASFVVSVTGTNLSYQWQRSGVDIANATSANYTTPVLSYADSGAKFTCVIKNSGGSVVTENATLSVELLPPTIVSQPLSQQVSEGSSASFVVSATGTNLSYQWQRSGVDIANATSANYTTPVLSYADSGAKFICVVKNSGGLVASDTALANIMPTIPAAVVVLDPANGFIATTDSMSFAWLRASSSVQEYAFQLATDSLMANVISSDTTTDSTVMIQGLRSGETYWWRVNAHNSSGWGSKGDAYSFSLDNPTNTKVSKSMEPYFAVQRSGIIYRIPQASSVSVSLYSLQGVELFSQEYGWQQPGIYSVSLPTLNSDHGASIFVFKAGELYSHKVVFMTR